MSSESEFLVESRGDVDAIERRCGELVDALASHHPLMREAIRYSLLGGGKRLRGVLTLWTHDFVGGAAREAALDGACAVECVHAYSLVHDDLPCMDDDDFRRGKPSCHARFGEATAVLTGDALLTLAFDILSTVPARHRVVGADVALGAIAALASASGTGGLIGGQALDLEAEGREGAVVGDVERIHASKTGRLIAAAMELGARIGGAPPEVCGRIREVGLLSGKAFQIVDDLLDLEADKETLGKTPGKDVKRDKLTYPSVAGVERSRSEAAELASRARSELAGLGGDPRRLHSAIEFIVERLA
jgi:geranylgeranyl diphosphate synthase type II